MSNLSSTSQTQYGDFQTPQELIIKIVHFINSKNISPRTMIEPTCGLGGFIQFVGRKISSIDHIIGIDINNEYIEYIQQNKNINELPCKVEVYAANFFEFDWLKLYETINQPILIIGNPPWVTNTKMSKLFGNNLPQKINQTKGKGMDVLMGNSNFDISESILRSIVTSLQNKKSYLVMICKSSVARKILKFVWEKDYAVDSIEILEFDSSKYFSISVHACVLFISFNPKITMNKYSADILDLNDFSNKGKITFVNGLLVNNFDKFTQFNSLLLKDGEKNSNLLKWRSGVKHDAASVMELIKHGNLYYNKQNDIVNIEEDLIYPLMKSSDLNHGRAVNKYIIMTQKKIGEDTNYIKNRYPKTWEYLFSHVNKFNLRRSRIYDNKPMFSIFGVGEYSFKKWKIAISSLYKNKSINFQLIGPYNDKPVMFDDTCYFIGFDKKSEAEKIYSYLNSIEVKSILGAMISWDDKRPIKAKLLNKIKLSIKSI